MDGYLQRLADAEICCDYLAGRCALGEDECPLDHPKWEETPSETKTPYWRRVLNAFRCGDVTCFRRDECPLGGHTRGPAYCKQCRLSRNGEWMKNWSAFYCTPCWEQWRAIQSSRSRAIACT